MTVENGVRILAGSLLLLSLALSVWVHPGWCFLAAFVGVNLVQSVFTGLCPAEFVLKKLGCKPRANEA